MKKRLTLIVSLILVAALFLSACSKKEPATTTPTTGTETTTETPAERVPGPTLVVGITEASGNFNPAFYSSAYDGYVVDMVFEGLITTDFDGNYIPNVAESWEVTEEGKKITFKIQEGIAFSDGEPLTAEDVVFTYQVLADPKYTGRYGTYVKDLLDYEAYSAGETTDFVGVVAIDEYTVEFNFKESLRVNLSNTGFTIMPKHVYGANFEIGSEAFMTELAALSSNPVGSGPYIVDKFQEKALVSLIKNDKYTRPGYEITDIILKFVEMTTDIVELTTGAVDLLAGQIEPTKINQAKDGGFNLNSYNRSGYGYIKTNNAYGATADKLVRQALYYSFNTKEFVNSYFLDEVTGDALAVVQYHPFSQVSWAIDDKILGDMIEYEFDLEKAAALLDEAGWTLGTNGIRQKDGVELELKIAAMPDHDILATLIPMWERDWGSLGIKLNISFLEFNTILDYVIYNSDANVEEWSMFFLANTIPTADPHSSAYTSFHSSHIGSGKDNTSRYSNPRVDELLDQGKSIVDVEAAKPVYAEIAKILNEDAVMMPVYANTYFDLYAPKLVDFETGSLYNWVKALRDARIEE